MEEQLFALLEYVRANGRVCPMPDYWNQLWDMLPDKKRLGSGWEPPLPLILAAWWDTPAMSKILRLQEHIRYAAEYGVLDEVDKFLRALSNDQWFKLNP
jgi:hypothetical protein